MLILFISFPLFLHGSLQFVKNTVLQIELIIVLLLFASFLKQSRDISFVLYFLMLLIRNFGGKSKPSHGQKRCLFFKRERMLE